MKNGLRAVLAVAVCGVACAGSALGATRIVSVYVESFAELQKQAALGAGAFQAPMLAALPMMMTGGLPGAAQMDNSKPVAMHLLALDGGETGMVIEVAPSAAPEAYLKALAGGEAEGALPEPKDGIYTLGKHMAAKVAGGRLYIVTHAKEQAALLGTDLTAYSELPTLPGVLRVSVEPQAVVPYLKKATASIPVQVNAPDAEKQRRAVERALGFYSGMLEQLKALHLGLNIQNEGVFVRSRLIPRAGSDIAALMLSGKPVSTKQQAFLKKDSLFSYASGGSTVPKTLENALIEMYTELVASSPMYTGGATNDWAAVLKQSIALWGVPQALAVSRPVPDGALHVQGCWQMDDPVGYLESQFAMMKEPFFVTMMKQSGIKFPGPTKRTVDDMKVYDWKMEFDEQAMEKTVRAAFPPDLPAEKADAAVAAHQQTFRTLKVLLGDGYTYATSGKDLILAMGGEAVLADAVKRAKASAGASAEADRIEALLSPSADPHSIGSIALARIIALSLAARPETADIAKGIPDSEGIVFAGWPFKGETLSAMLIPTSEIKAITAAAMAGQAAARKRNAPARPPVPDNF
mgnify:FL=1